MHSVILIPAYKPGSALLELVDRLLLTEVAHMVIVDDGSGDDYAHLFQALEKKARVTVLRHPENRGKGAALRTGFSYISKGLPQGSAVITVDADGQHLPEDVERILHEVEDHPGALVLGFRRMSMRVPLRSMLGNKVTRFLYGVLSGRRLKDTQTGLRGIPTELLPLLADLKSDRYAYEMETLLTLSKANIHVREIPIATVYEDGNQGSHFRPIADSYIIYRLLFTWWFRNRLVQLFKYSLSGITSAVVDFGFYALLVSLSFTIVTASVIARVLAVMTHFTANKYFTFSQRTVPTFSEIFRYLMVVVFNLVSSILIIILLVDHAAVDKVSAKVVAQALLFFITYALMRYFVFFKSET